MKALPKKRKHQMTRNLLVNLSKSSLFKWQVLWYSSCIAAYVWFMYWVAYDFFVWYKPIFEANLVNYIGSIAAIALTLAGTKIFKPNQVKMARLQQTVMPQKPEPQLEKQQRAQKPVPADSGCVHYLGYLNQRQKQRDIPSGCLMCKHVIKCMNYTN